MQVSFIMIQPMCYSFLYAFYIAFHDAIESHSERAEKICFNLIPKASAAVRQIVGENVSHARRIELGASLALSPARTILPHGAKGERPSVDSEFYSRVQVWTCTYSTP